MNYIVRLDEELPRGYAKNYFFFFKHFFVLLVLFFSNQIESTDDNTVGSMARDG